MEKKICDRCGRLIEGPAAIAGLWAEDGVRGSGLPTMNALPAVHVMNLCPACRAEAETIFVTPRK